MPTMLSANARHGLGDVDNVLVDVLNFMEHRDRMNAAVHQAEVRYSPLTESTQRARALVRRILDGDL